MTRSSDIASVWEDSVWNHATVAAWTSRKIPYEFSIEAEVDAGIYYEQRVNFFTYTIYRIPQDHTLGGRGYVHTVRVLYALEGIENYATVRDRLEVLEELVYTELGTDWNETVQIAFTPERIEIEEVKIDERRCWRGGWNFGAQSY